MLNPIKNPNGDQHHTEIGIEPADVRLGNALARVLGGLFVDKENDPDRPHKESYFHREMTSRDIWTRVARALRFHGLEIINAGGLSDAFDRGFKAAGGTMIPDGARDQVELSLDRGQINALADAAEEFIDRYSNIRQPEPALHRFLETISIYRSKR